MLNEKEQVSAENRIYDIDNFPYGWFAGLPALSRKRGNQGTKNRTVFIDCVSAFDIETTTINVGTSDNPNLQAIMYIWQWSFNGEVTITGRTWGEFVFFYEKINKILNRRNMDLIAYVHNLSYEFQFLSGILQFETDDVFCLDSRKIAKAKCDRTEFRCSYVLTNNALGKFLKDMKVKHQKLELDYFETRYPWTPLSDDELNYCINDVIGLCEALIVKMQITNDNLYSIPMTATGYVRRDVKHILNRDDRLLVQSMAMDEIIYTMLKLSFRGGNSHANRYYAGKYIDNVYTKDRSSSYPTVLITQKFPISKFIPLENPNIDTITKLINQEYALLMTIRLYNVDLQDIMLGCPYIPISKCTKLVNEINDNGRVLACDMLEMTLTDIDFKIILEQYSFSNIEYNIVYYAKYGMLPTSLRELIKKYYVDKTSLKGIEEKEKDYINAKERINSVYGMCATDPIRQSVKYVNGEYIEQEINILEMLDKANKKAFLAYAWGIWTSAHARKELQEAINLVGDNFIYTDTDSVKYDSDIDFSSLNSRLEKEALENEAYATDIKGNIHYMGVWEDEGKYDLFSTLGAKKYCFLKDGKLNTTIAGVDKSKGGQELEKKGGIKAFKEGFIFTEAGGVELIYNDDEYGKFYIDNHEIYIYKNVVIKNSTYKLGITADYERLLNNISFAKIAPTC